LVEVAAMMGWNWDGGSWVAMGLGMVAWLVVAVLVVWLVVRGLIALERPRADALRRPEPEEILRERFARGEIDSDEYERRLALLRAD
jgi:putative membrane protein